jgi:small GTP-binding protein
MLPLKVLITGAVGAGKTTLVSTLSEIEALTTDVDSQEAIGKNKTTVGLDYGRMTLRERSVRLFGTPGQERFDYMWQILGEGVDAMIVLVHAGHDTAEADTEHLLDTLRANEAADVPFVAGITHVDEAGAHPEALRKASFAQRATAVLTADVRTERDGHALIHALADAWDIQ